MLNAKTPIKCIWALSVLRSALSKKRAKLKKAPPVNIKKLLRLLFMYNTQQ
jgi:hypothetical protein